MAIGLLAGFLLGVVLLLVRERSWRDDWEADGALDMRERARRKARQILSAHRPDPIPPEIDEAIRRRFEILLPKELAGFR